MFDTVRASVDEVELNLDRLMQKGFKKVVTTAIDQEGVVTESLRYVLMEKDQHPHFVMYLPKVGTVKFETSLPKAVPTGSGEPRGENVSLLASEGVIPCLDRVSSFLCDRCGDVPAAGDFKVRGRLDAVFSWDARVNGQDLTPYYLHALRNVVVPRHTTQVVDREATLYWWNGSRRVRMYDKYRESKLDAAKGQLRFEVQLNHAKGELEKLGYLGDAMLKNVLNWDNASRVLDEYLNQIAGGLVIASGDQVLLDLLKVYKPSKALRLYGWMNAMQRFARRDIERMGMSRWTARRVERDVTEAGLAGFSPDDGPSVLPPLRLPEKYDGLPGRVC